MHRNDRRAWSALGFTLASLLCAAAAASEPAPPRTLVLALDGISYRVLERARAQGGFAGWPAPSRVVAPFPSMTNVSFSAMLLPLGGEPAPGYELQYFDRSENRIRRVNPFNYHERAFFWRQAFDVGARRFGGELAAYATPRSRARKELRRVTEGIESTGCDPLLGYVVATDALSHLRGDESVLRFLGRLDRWLAGLKAGHRERTGRPLRILLVSDHGNTSAKVHGVQGIHRLLRRAGLRVTRRLKRPDDVVAPTFGVVSYGALYLVPEAAERAARAVVQHRAVELAAWRSGSHAIRVTARRGAAEIRWTGAARPRRLVYLPEGAADPLDLLPARGRLAARGALDGEGYADEAAWFEETALGAYPDALGRLVDALAGTGVDNPATVLFSLQPGFAWGWPAAQASSWLSGGRLEGTHGGLDHDSTLGIYMTDDPALARGPALRVDQALGDLRRLWEEAGSCSRLEGILDQAATGAAEPR